MHIATNRALLNFKSLVKLVMQKFFPELDENHPINCQWQKIRKGAKIKIKVTSGLVMRE